MTGTVTLDRRRLYVVFAGLMLAMSLGALDQAIVTTAQPTIVADLGGLEHLAWVVTAYLLASTAVTPLWGKLGDLHGRKTIFIATIGIFLAGSALCGLSRSMTALIGARALQGAGGGGLIVTTQATIGDIVSPRERGRYQGIFGAVFALTSVIGPLVGGFFVDYLSWHWVFLVNIPIGIAALAITVVALPPLSTRTQHTIDYLGATLIAAATTCLVLAMSLGGVTFPWTSPPIVAAFVIGVLLTGAFLRVERLAHEPLLPPSLFRNRVFRVAGALGFVVGGAMLGPVTILPLFMQVANGVSPTESGLRLLPLLLAVPTMSIISGQVISRRGRYRIFPIVGTALMTIGLLLLSRLTATTPLVESSIAMAILGLGLGMVMQVLVLAVQNAVDFRDLGAATSGVTFFRAMGSVFGVALFGGLFTSRLTAHLAALHLPPTLAGGAVETQAIAIAGLPETLRVGLAQAYGAALPPVFLAAVPFAALAFLMSWRLEEIPLRETVSATRPETTIGPAVDVRSSAEIERLLSDLMTREGRRNVYERLARRAQIELSPIGCWLLFRLDEFKPATIDELASAVSVPIDALADRLELLAARGLITIDAAPNRGERRIGMTPTGSHMLDRLVWARREGLRNLVRSWVPERSEELDELLRRLARVMVPDLRVES
jgi:EmrB/QacA subfamily drug resistance transporter